jgi:hypothetical protein
LKSVHPTYDERVNIEDIKIDMTPCVNKRAEQFLAQIKNPYAFRCGEIAVNIVFLSEGKSLKESVTSYLRNQKK